MTTKLGSSDKRPGTGSSAVAVPKPALRFYMSELMMSTFVLTAAFYGIFSVNKWSFSIFLTLQGGGALPALPHALTPAHLVPEAAHAVYSPLAFTSAHLVRKVIPWLPSCAAHALLLSCPTHACHMPTAAHLPPGRLLTPFCSRRWAPC